MKIKTTRTPWFTDKEEAALKIAEDRAMGEPDPEFDEDGNIIMPNYGGDGTSPF